tara:strand:+ start:3919 stop:4125 length:207 start_codon:yes stop_codon:yes gene_type:complete
MEKIQFQKEKELTEQENKTYTFLKNKLTDSNPEQMQQLHIKLSTLSYNMRLNFIRNFIKTFDEEYNKL